MKVWDPLVRICHWILVAAFIVAYLTDDDLLTVHAWAGYVVGCIVVLRVIWGFVGSKHARFSDFVFGPWKVWRYVIDLVRFRAERYIGHSPAGGAMVVALIIGLAATVWSGLETYAVEENAGPLAGATIISAASADAPPKSVRRIASNDDERKDDEGSDRENDRGDEDEFWEEIHEILADLTLALVIMHVLGVAIASAVHRENLVRAMFTGKKRGA